MLQRSKGSGEPGVSHFCSLFRSYISNIHISNHLFIHRYVPPNWTYESDEDLVHYFYEYIGREDENLGSVKQCVTSIDVSSCLVSCI